MANDGPTAVGCTATLQGKLLNPAPVSSSVCEADAENPR